MTEDELLSAVTAGTRKRPGLAKLLGIAWYHPYDSRRSTSGWPDLVLLGRHGALFRELKSAAGRLTQAQAHFGALLRMAGLDWDVWGPADLASGRIAREMQAIK